jgi:hypothetical protein
MISIVSAIIVALLPVLVDWLGDPRRKTQKRSEGTSGKIQAMRKALGKSDEVARRKLAAYQSDRVRQALRDRPD